MDISKYLSANPEQAIIEAQAIIRYSKIVGETMDAWLKELESGNLSFEELVELIEHHVEVINLVDMIAAMYGAK